MQLYLTLTCYVFLVNSDKIIPFAVLHMALEAGLKKLNNMHK